MSRPIRGFSVLRDRGLILTVAFPAQTANRDSDAPSNRMLSARPLCIVAEPWINAHQPGCAPYVMTRAPTTALEPLTQRTPVFRAPGA